jgi:hypothetical protein
MAPLDREPKVVVIMAGDHLPSFIASARPFATFPALTAAAGEPSKADERRGVAPRRASVHDAGPILLVRSLEFSLRNFVCSSRKQGRNSPLVFQFLGEVASAMGKRMKFFASIFFKKCMMLLCLSAFISGLID